MSLRLIPTVATIALVGAWLAFLVLPILAAFVDGVLS